MMEQESKRLMWVRIFTPSNHTTHSKIHTHVFAGHLGAYRRDGHWCWWIFGDLSRAGAWNDPQVRFLPLLLIQNSYLLPGPRIMELLCDR